MNIGIIGGGVVGISAVHELGRKGHKIAILEKGAELGGQASIRDELQCPVETKNGKIDGC
jgi:glycine/D-amino acid oxidase-like deaminating enzyme